MPGMIDAHAHLVGMANTMVDLMLATQTQLAAATLARAKDTLLRGFTTVRDMGATPSASRRSSIPNRRSVPASTPARPRSRRPPDTATSASSTNVRRPWAAVNRAPRRSASCGWPTAPDRVLAAVREQLKLGASQIKADGRRRRFLLYDPLSTVQFTSTELRAAVRAATDYGTYVATHVYNVPGIRARRRGGREVHRARPSGR